MPENSASNFDRPIRIAVDAMGGDFAPGETVAGAVQAARRGNVQVMLVGDPSLVRTELAKLSTDGLPIRPVPSEGVISEGDSPALALRQKPRASIIVATGLVKQGQADACVTMGSTGAAMAAAAVLLGVIDGIDRPTLGGPVIGLSPHTVIIDVGTSVDCRPSQMLSFAVIGDVFARISWGIERPRVALLSVGAESGKGNRLVRETTDLLAKSGLNFIGNVEASDIPLGKAEVVVCDGFVGNVVMKLTEGLGSAMAEYLRARLASHLPEAELAKLAKDVYEINNPAESAGGGPLFGVKGVSVIGHGWAKADAVERAIGTARLQVEQGFVTKLNNALTDARVRTGVAS